MASRKTINRRQSLGHLGAVGGATALAACAPSTIVPAPVEAPAAQTLKTVNFAIGAVTSADNLDPAFRTSTSDAQFQAAVYEGLLTRDENLRPTPNLVKS